MGQASEFSGSEKMAWIALATKEATVGDKTLLFTGLFLALAFGASRPALCLFMGNMMGGMGSSTTSGGGFSNLS